MKKRFFNILLVIALLLSITSLVFADDEYIDDIPNDAHKIRNKWDAAGSFTSQRDISNVGRTWYFELHIKEAMYGPYSKGVILFTSGDDVITGYVKDVKTNYPYWSANDYMKENLAAVGWADYAGSTYYFMFLYCEGGIWIILSDNTPYDAHWSAGNVFQSTERTYQVLSSPWHPNASEYDFDPKQIHSD